MARSNIKVQDVKVLAEGVSSPLSIVQDVRKYQNFAIQVDYDAGLAGNLELEASVDGVDYSPIPSSQQAVDPAGGTHIWNVTNAHYLFVRIVIPGTGNISNVQFVGATV